MQSDIAAIMEIIKITNTEGMRKMLKWPGTPGGRRLRKAFEMRLNIQSELSEKAKPYIFGEEPSFEIITDSAGVEHCFDTSHENALDIRPRNVDEADACAMHDVIQAVKFSQAVNKLFLEMDFRKYRGGTDDKDIEGLLTPDQWYSAAVTQFVCAMATHGEGLSTIGMAFQRFSLEDTTKSAYVFTKLSRHRDWIGFNPNLENVSRVRFVIHPSAQGIDVPGYAIGYPAEDNNLDDRAGNAFPDGQATVLRDLLLAHGSPQCVWDPERIS